MASGGSVAALESATAMQRQCRARDRRVAAGEGSRRGYGVSHALALEFKLKF